MLKQELTIWGRKFNLDVVFDCYAGEQPTDTQKQALQNLVNSNLDFEQVKQNIKTYCLGYDPTIVLNNIFKYVVPQAIYLKRTKDTSRVVGIMCAFKLDIEHGLAIVFKDEQFVKIVQQDALL